MNELKLNRKLFIISNNRSTRIKCVLEKLNIYTYFEQISGIDNSHNDWLKETRYNEIRNRHPSNYNIAILDDNDNVVEHLKTIISSTDKIIKADPNKPFARYL